MPNESTQKIVRAVHDRLQYVQTMGVTEIPATAGAVRATRDARRATDLAAIRAEIGDCTRCGLCAGRTNLVFGVGDPHARLMFVGEAPGAEEDRLGEPFVGRSGQLLDKIIGAMGLSRATVYIANIIKCRPPDNRAPLPTEALICRPFLLQQIAVIKPAVIVCLGSTAVKYLFDDESIKISQVRGIFREWNGVHVMPTYHPAFLLRNPAMKKPVWDDMRKVMSLLRQ